MEFFATCPGGFEDLLTDELKVLGLSQVRKLKGQVSFEGDLKDAYKACLWSRLASRIIAVLDRIDSADSDELYESVQSIDWSEHIGRGKTIIVDAKGVNDNLRNTQFSAMRTKDAISDQLQNKEGWRPQVDVEHPDLRIYLRINKNKATIGIDLSGEPLFRRGYELGKTRLKTIVPLRPDYACALLNYAGWFKRIRRDYPTLIVPFVGAGTICAEALSQLQDRAPGLMRRTWGFQGWLKHDENAWEELVAEAERRLEESKDKTCRIIASDTRPNCEMYTKQMLGAAGLSTHLTYIADPFAKKAFAKELHNVRNNPVCVANLSWIDPDDLPQEAKVLSLMSLLKDALPEETSLCTYSHDTLIDATLGLEPEETERVWAGNVEAAIRKYTTKKGEPSLVIECSDRAQVPCLVSTSDQFASRLTKVYKQRRKWAQKEFVTCYRIYDQDLPDYAVSIDLYISVDEKRRWLVINEYQAPKDIDPDVAKRRLIDILALSPHIIGVDPRDTHLRVRTHAKGGSQYKDGGTQRNKKGRRDSNANRLDERRKRNPLALEPGEGLVDENGLVFEVHFKDKLDTGLFLDHRDTRNMLREMMKETKGSKRFLNLFAYTGTATCYAADGGAKYTTTVDMSGPYLAWARRNMERNGFDGKENEFIQADVIQWVHEQRHTHNRWDLIFCDPPTFSNSSSMRSKSFDVQRDHAELLIDISRLLTREGVCVFSCNLRNFKPDIETLEKAGVSLEDITPETIPEDFKRSPKIHHCYLMKRFK